ncbi:hypothetical protein BDR03DRAFT_986359 [Suillus americanus]|nr:hypothetical protein BDR03DRAFT_986359 [Suillus americanus]
MDFYYLLRTWYRVVNSTNESLDSAKYPLAVVSKSLDVFGKRLGAPSDHSHVHFNIPAWLAPSMAMLTGAYVNFFTYNLHQRSGPRGSQKCEQTFSKSNSLASALRYASVFHRRQAIDSYFKHNDDFEVYTNLSDFLYNNYKQALDILHDGNAALPKLMQELKVGDVSIFERWLEDEKAYLVSLMREPEEETLQMEYWQRLVILAASSGALDAAMAAFELPSPKDAASYKMQVRHTRKAESAHHHTQEDHERNIKMVQALECKLKITEQWGPGDIEWQTAGRLVADRKYQRALDHLEGLIVAWIFELSKMNRAGTGKSHTTHGVATTDCIQAINYENISLRHYRLAPSLSDISERPWSSAAARSAMDLHFKMCRAREEIKRLDIEVRRLVTYIWDEENYLRECEDQLNNTSPALAYQIAIHRNT